ncbi:hypothetical protein V8E54_011724 [Elaphomyces granulatus]
MDPPTMSPCSIGCYFRTERQAGASLFLTETRFRILGRAEYLRRGRRMQAAGMDDATDPSFMGSRAWCSDQLCQVPLYLLTAFLREKSPGAMAETRAFIIHPANSSMFSPDALLSSLISEQCHRNPLLSRDDAINILDTVQLLPVFDFPGAVQAIGAVSSALHSFRQRQYHKDIEESEMITATSESVILIIVEGLDVLAEGVIRTSNPLRGSALLTSALRTLTHLVRTYASFLSVMLVNTSGLGGTSYASNNDQPASTDQERPSPSITQTGNRDRDGGLNSIFPRPGTMSSLLPTLLSRTVDQGIDTHLLLSLVEGGRIVEVIKDRTGDSMGRWCVWGNNAN